jgi:hypothetical protein
MKKSISFKGLCLALAFTLAGFMAQAQLTNSVYLNFGFPTGQFHTQTTTPIPGYILTKDNIAHDAAVGIGFGYRASYRFDVGFGNVDPFVSGDFFWNRVRGDVRDAIIENNGKSSYYINVPILIGAQYNYAINENIRPFAEFGVGYDIFMVGNEGWKDNGIWATYKVNGAMAFQIGAGCYFGEHVSAGLNFYGLGKHTINYGSKTSDGLSNPTPILDANGNITNAAEIANADKNVQRRANILALRIGFHF